MARRRQHGEGSLYQRSWDGMWVAAVELGWRDGKRRRRTFTGATPDVAIAARAAFLALRRDGFTMPPGRQPYVNEWMLHWLHNIARRKVEASTWERSYRQKVTRLIVPYFERVPLPDLDEEMIEAWHAQLQDQVSARTGRPLSTSTIAQAHRIMSSALKVAVARKRMPRNPCSGVSPPSDTSAQAAEPPTAEEVLGILRECEDRRTGPRWVTAVATGMRQGEVLGLLWPHADLGDVQDASLAVEWTLTRQAWQHGCGDPHGCGAGYHRYPCPRPCPKVRQAGRPHACVRPGDEGCCPPGCEAHARRCPERTGGGLRLKRPKTEKSRAAIPLAPYAAAALRQWRKDQAAERLAHPGWRGWAHDDRSCNRRPRPGQHVCPGCMLPAEPGLLVFSRPDGLPVDPRADWQDWSDLLEAAGLPHYRVHDSRHGLATMLLEDGMDVRVVQEIMRHSTPDFTRRAYQHVRPHLKRDAADAIERRLRGGR
jgi:integrase